MPRIRLLADTGSRGMEERRTGRASGRWRRIAAGLIAAAAAMAALAAAGVGIPGGGPPDGRDLRALEAVGHGHVHHPGEARADRRRLARCARRSVVRRDPRCPRPRRAGRGARAHEVVATGAWTAPFRVPSWPIHQVLLPTGRVLWFMPSDDRSRGGRALVWDPATRTSREITPPPVPYPDGRLRPADLFCTGHAQLSDGRILLAGGNLAYPTGPGPGEGWKGAPWVITFDPWTETFTRQPDMARARWYPTVTTLPDGRALIVAGWDDSGDEVDVPEVELFTPSPRIDGRGSLAVVTRRVTGLYPHMWVVPETTAAGAAAGTQVLIAGPDPDDTAILSTAGWTWRDVPDLPTKRLWGAGVIMPGGPDGPDRVMLIGGSDTSRSPSAQSSTIVLDLDRVSSGWAPGPPLATPRSHLNVTLLPDGGMLAVGGGAGIGPDESGASSLRVGPVYAAERLDPGAGAWTSAGSQADERTYHSTALLLPDGRVLSAGDDRASHSPPEQRTGEIYTPPHLLSGPRPAISSAPGAVRYDAAFEVGVADPASIDRAVLVRPGSVTHANDMEQRLVGLRLERGHGRLVLTSPADPSIALPGYHMLFLVDRSGRPSPPRWIRLDPGAPDPPPAPDPTPDPGTPPAAGPAPAPVSAPAAAPPPNAVAPAAPLPTVVRARLTGRRLRIVLAVPMAPAASVRLALRRAGAPRPLARRLAAGTAPVRLAVFTVRVPRRWRALRLPLTVRIDDAAGARSRRAAVVVRRTGGRLRGTVVGR